MRFSERPVAGLELAYDGELLHEERSPFQLIQVFEHPTFGRMLVLDGLVQTSERDEYLYHEMLAHVPLLSHPEPKAVLIVGGGDGGALRRVLEHPSVERAVMVEIDERVTAVSRELLPSVAGTAFDDPRVELRFADGDAFVRDTTEEFDAVVVDSSDPVGPGVVLFGRAFYAAVLARLTEAGVLSAQIGSPILMPNELARAASNAAEAFPERRVYTAPVATYPGVLWAYLLAGRTIDVDAGTARRRAADRGLQTRCWTPEFHAGAFALPEFIWRLLAGGPAPLEDVR